MKLWLDQPESYNYIKGSLNQMSAEKEFIEQDYLDIIETISQSYLFDHTYYNKEANINGEKSDAIRHYVDIGEPQGVSPSSDFDPVFYGICNPDVEQSEHNKLFHYIKYGQQEGRYPNIESMSNDDSIVSKSDSLDVFFLEQTVSAGLLPDLTSVQRYLALWRLGARLNKNFDDHFYISFYPDVSLSGLQPYIHYLRFGIIDARFVNLSQAQHIISCIAPHFDKGYYLSQCKDRNEIDDNNYSIAEHYCNKGYFLGLKPCADFDPVFYYRKYTDISEAHMNTFYHYVLHGRDEGRLGASDFSKIIAPGLQKHERSRPTVLVACHEASRTGAPLVGLNIISSLQQKYNVISYLGREGELVDTFRSESIALVIRGNYYADDMLLYLKRNYNLSAVLLNSVETDHLAQAALTAQIPCVALVHEFAEYTLPVGRVTDLVRRVDRVIVPARLIEESLQKEISNIAVGEAPNIRVMPQGKLPWIPVKSSETDMTSKQIKEFLSIKLDESQKIVLGAGSVGIRKGLDLFVQTAYYLNKIRKDVIFVWVGHGYNPRRDATYSVWVNQMIERMGLTSIVRFIPEQSNLSEVFSLSDIFFMSSRMDPFPNVVIDAIEANRPIVCFKDGTGCADLIDDGTIYGKSVSYCDVAEAATAINSLLLTTTPESVILRNKEKLFDFKLYIDAVEEELQTARLLKSQSFDAEENIYKSGKFDCLFYEGTQVPKFDTRKIIRDYVASSSKGLSRRNPAPGFSDNKFRMDNSVPQGSTPLSNSLNANHESIDTHLCYRNINISKKYYGNMKCAMHIHLHYPEIAEDFAKRLISISKNIDIFITVTSKRALYEVKDAFPENIFRSVKVLLVANQGRDLGPFLIDFNSEMNPYLYYLVGHFHGKKSLELGGTTGNEWRSYLLDTLIGENNGVMEGVFSKFDENKNLGLIFAEDPNCVGWSDNSEFGDLLCKRLDPKPVMHKRPVFPIGSMFWARPNALSSLWSANFQRSEMPVEPVPYDGTIIHAIERIIPAVCESNGYNWATIYNDRLKR